jgi:hypothetical protein
MLLMAEMQQGVDYYINAYGPEYIVGCEGIHFAAGLVCFLAGASLSLWILTTLFSKLPVRRILASSWLFGSALSVTSHLLLDQLGWA